MTYSPAEVARRRAFMRAVNAERANRNGLAKYDASRRAAALPRWERVASLRKTGLKLREVAALLQVRVSTVHKMEQNWIEHCMSKIP